MMTLDCMSTDNFLSSKSLGNLTILPFQQATDSDEGTNAAIVYSLKSVQDYKR